MTTIKYSSCQLCNRVFKEGDVVVGKVLEATEGGDAIISWVHLECAAPTPPPPRRTR